MRSAPRRRLLLVEAARLVRDVLYDRLVDAGFDVDTARTSTEAVERLTDQRYAAIVTDCVLPNLAPIDWLGAIRGVAPDTPLVLYSGIVVPDDLQHLACDWGAAAVLEKPFAPAELRGDGAERGLDTARPGTAPVTAARRREEIPKT